MFFFFSLSGSPHTQYLISVTKKGGPFISLFNLHIISFAPTFILSHRTCMPALISKTTLWSFYSFSSFVFSFILLFFYLILIMIMMHRHCDDEMDILGVNKKRRQKCRTLPYKPLNGSFFITI
ncbi:hypothetical protein ACOSQ3_005831 [Xanthoceras sorbifolium]